MPDLRTAIARRLRQVAPTQLRTHGYTNTPADNLLPELDRDIILEDFRTGDGGELRGSAPKFCAAHSSAALAANSFGPFRVRPAMLTLAGVAGFTEARFEKQLPTGLRGTPPNLDFFASGPAAVVAVESKFTEFLSPKPASFAASYENAIRRLAEPGWAVLYRSLLDAPSRFGHLDAAQVVKHYLGLRHTCSRWPIKVLVYAYWEPTNSEQYPAFAAHRSDLAAFAAATGDSEVRFFPISYPELWRSWLGTIHWAGIASHVAALEARYSVEG